jgi:hypothetical protein
MSDSEESAEILNPEYKPNLFDIHRYYDSYCRYGQYKPVVGNNESRMTIPLLFGLQKVSVVVKGPAGSGKSTIARAAANLIWGDKVLHDEVKEVFYIAGTSEKALLTDTLANRIANICTHCVVPELQNAISNERVEAIIKLWTEGEAYPYKRADHGGRITREITLRPLPILTSIATENKYTERLGEEMERRFFPFYTTATLILNKEIHKVKAMARAKCDEDNISMSEEEKKILRYHLQSAMKSKKKVRNPSAVYMEETIPSNYVVSNSMIEYWFELVEGVTRFHYPERMSYKDKYLMATPGDNYLAWRLGGSAIVLASLNIPDLGREVIEILPIRDQLDPSARKSLNDIIDDLQKIGVERTRKQVLQIMKALESVNYARRDDYNKEDYYKTQNYKFDTSVDWGSAIASTVATIKETQPEIAKDYIEEYCKEPKVVDPFTNKVISLLDIPFEKVPEKPVKETLQLEKYF